MKWGTVGEGEKGMGRKGEGGQYTANLGSEWTGIAPRRKGGCGVWVLTAFWGTLFQLAVSPFNWIDTVMQDVGRKVGLLLESEAIREPEVEEMDEQNMESLRKKYPWWLGSQGRGEPTAPARGSGAEAENIVNLTQGKLTKV